MIWVLIGYLALGPTGGPFTAEFESEAACEAAAETIRTGAAFAVVGRSDTRAIRAARCFPKGALKK